MPAFELIDQPAHSAPIGSEAPPKDAAAPTPDLQQNATECDTFSRETPPPGIQLTDTPILTTQNDPPNSAPAVAPAVTTALATTSDLSPQQQTALLLLLTGKPDGAVAATLGLHRSTIVRWRLHNPAFRTQLQQRREEIYQAASDRLRTLLMKSLMILNKALHDRHPDKRVDAARHILRLINTKRLADPRAWRESETEDDPSVSPVVTTVISCNDADNRGAS
jgi:hypothetical protein